MKVSMSKRAIRPCLEPFKCLRDGSESDLELRARLTEIVKGMNAEQMSVTDAERTAYDMIQEHVGTTGTYWRGVRFASADNRAQFMQGLRTRGRIYSLGGGEMPLSAISVTAVAFASSEERPFGMVLEMDSSAVPSRPVRYSEGEEEPKYLYQAEVRTQFIPTHAVRRVITIDGLSMKNNRRGDFEIHDVGEYDMRASSGSTFAMGSFRVPSIVSRYMLV